MGSKVPFPTSKLRKIHRSFSKRLESFQSLSQLPGILNQTPGDQRLGKRPPDFPVWTKVLCTILQLPKKQQ